MFRSRSHTRLQRKENDYRAKREEVLTAAERIFSRKGFNETFMTDIAEAVPCSIGSLYKFFPSKEALYIALIEEHFQEFLHHLRQEISAQLNPLAALEVIVKTHLDYFEQHKDFFMIYMNDRLALEWRIKERLGENIHRLHLTYLGLVTQVMEGGEESGILKPLAPQDLAHLLISMVNSTIFQWVHTDHDSPLRSKLPVILDIFFYGARNHTQT